MTNRRATPAEVIRIIRQELAKHRAANAEPVVPDAVELMEKGE